MKVEDLIALLLRRCDTEHMAPPLKTRLVKLLYLAELEYLRRTGSRLTSLQWRFHHFGPYAPELAAQLGDPNSEAITWKYLFQPASYEHKAEKAVADVVREWGKADLNTLLDYVYFETEPMQSAQRGDPLDFATVKPLTSDAKLALKLDPKKLTTIRKALQQRAKEYGKLREAATSPDELFENLREWDLERNSRPTGQCHIDPKRLN